MQKRKLEELNLLDDFLFNAMLTHPDTGEAFSERLLKLLFNREFKKLKISMQKTYNGLNTDLRGARLDVCIEEDGCVSIDGEEVPCAYDVEPDHNDGKKHVAVLPKRSRFYHAIIDSRSLKSGEDFGKLKRVYVIFICDYDPFGYDRVIYTIRNRCLEEPEMPYDDGAETIILYTRGKKGKVTEELRQFLTYMENTTQNNAVNEDLKDIQKMVNIVKRDGEVSLRYMKWFEHDQLMIDQGRQEERENTERERKRADEERGRAEKERKRADEERGRADKAEQQAKEMEAITKYLIADKRFADLERAVDDLDFRKKLLKEYKIG